jgi:hypothetical protein
MAAQMQNPGLAPRASRGLLILVASLLYRIGSAGANAPQPFLSVAMDGVALVWGVLR